MSFYLRPQTLPCPVCPDLGLWPVSAYASSGCERWGQRALGTEGGEETHHPKHGSPSLTQRKARKGTTRGHTGLMGVWALTGDVVINHIFFQGRESEPINCNRGEKGHPKGRHMVAAMEDQQAGSHPCALTFIVTNIIHCFPLAHRHSQCPPQTPPCLSPCHPQTSVLTTATAGKPYTDA